MNFFNVTKILALSLLLIPAISIKASAEDESDTIVNAVTSLQSQSQKLYVSLPSSHYIPVTLHPDKSLELNRPTIVSFGVPFPRNTLFDTAAISISTAQDKELAAQIHTTSRWHSLQKKFSPESIRSILAYTEVTFRNHEPMTLHVRLGIAPKRPLQGDIKLIQTWKPVSEGVNPTEYSAHETIMEPAVYATLPAAWLSACLLRTRPLPMGEIADMNWFDNALAHFSDTAVNDVSKSVRTENLIEYEQDHEPWLYDRALTLYGLYIRSGELKWLRHAHRASQFYARHIDSNGYFDRKKGYKDSPPNDIKYSYGQSMLIDLMLTGDTQLRNKIEAVANAATHWNSRYTYQDKRPILWTERHQTYALLATLSAWEATGKTQYAKLVRTIINNTFMHTTHPPQDWEPEGCPLHAYKDHEGFGTNKPVCSPWMNALLAEAVFRYYIHSEDNKALQYLDKLGDYLAHSGTYRWSKGGTMQGLLMPHYLSSHAFKRYPDGSWDDHHHACDVAGAAARSTWARKVLGTSTETTAKLTRELLKTCQYSLNYMHRKNADTEHGKTVWRLSVPRQYSWWFGSTLDLSWLLESQSATSP